MSKHTASCLIACVLASVLLSSCGQKQQETGPPPAAVIPPAAGVSGSLKPSGGQTKVFLDYIGTANTSTQGAGKANVLGAAPIVFSGWAIDGPNKVLASGVDVVIDNVPYSATYGVNRDDVADALKDPSLRKCGYTLKMPGGLLPKGDHTVSVRAISQDRQTYTQGAAIPFTVN